MADLEQITTGFSAREEELDLREELEELEAREILSGFSSGALLDELSRRLDFDQELEGRARESFECPYCKAKFGSKASVSQSSCSDLISELMDIPLPIFEWISRL